MSIDREEEEVARRSSALATVGSLFVFALMFLLLALYYALAVMLLWNWFVAPLGLPQIGIARAYGIFLFAGLFRQYGEEKENVSATFLIPAFAMLLGYIVKAWM